MLNISFIIAAIVFLTTGGGVIFLCTQNRYEDALVTLIGGVIMSALIGGAPLAISKTNQKIGGNKMEENYITIDFTEEEVDEILAEYYGLDIKFPTDKELLEEKKMGISEDDFKRIVLEKIL
jgi:hypothetical protein